MTLFWNVVNNGILIKADSNSKFSEYLEFLRMFLGPLAMFPGEPVAGDICIFTPKHAVRQLFLHDFP